MKKSSAVVTVIFALATNVYAQFPYATANLTDGSISCKTQTTVITTLHNKMISKTVSEATFSTDLKIAIGLSDEDLELLDLKNYPDQRLPFIANGNNFARTLNETEDLATAIIPRLDAHLTHESKYWGPDPCDDTNNNIVLQNTSVGSGPVADRRRGVNVSIEGLKDEKEYFFVKVFAGGGWGEIMDIDMKSKIFKPDPDDDYKCKWFTEPGGNYNMTGPRTCDVFLGGTDMPETFSKRSAGYYTRFEPGGNGNDEYSTEYTLLKIDTGQIFSYIRKPSFKSFSLMGSYRHISKNTDTSEVIETIEICTVTLNFGKVKNELILSMENDEEYHNWLPVINTPAAGYKLLKVKGELKSEDDVRKDTLHFYLNNVSHHKGKCTNFPEKDQADYKADLWFSNPQSDKNVRWIDSLHVKTIDPVKEVTVDIECDDFAASGNVSARAVNKNVKGFSKYDNSDTLKFPEDENKNFIADKWEKDVGIFNKSLRPESDGDALPAGQKGLGDGWTLFEEYRGFYSEKDFLKKSDNVQRKGEFIRTDPDYKDVFVYDATKTSIPPGLFETNFAPANAAKLNWHMLRDKQVIHYSTGSINRELLLSGEMTVGLAKVLNDYDHRWLNYNTPLKYRLKKHYCLFLMLSDLLNYSDILGKCFHFMQNPEKTTPIDQCEIIIFPNQPKEATLQGIRGRCESSMSATQKTTIAENVYISTTIHEMGHAIGIEHHSNGTGKFDNNGTNLPISLSMRDAIADKKSSAYREYDDALCACGVRNCAMRYTMMYKEEFTGGELLTLSQTIFCNSTQKYTDSYGTEHPADGCFNAINAK